MTYYKICSHEHGQQCDLFPYGSVHHSDKIKDGKIINSNSELLPPFEIEKLEEKPEKQNIVLPGVDWSMPSTLHLLKLSGSVSV